MLQNPETFRGPLASLLFLWVLYASAQFFIHKVWRSGISGANLFSIQFQKASSVFPLVYPGELCLLQLVLCISGAQGFFYVVFYGGKSTLCNYTKSLRLAMDKLLHSWIP
jgi:hypothetical protein